MPRAAETNRQTGSSEELPMLDRRNFLRILGVAGIAGASGLAGARFTNGTNPAAPLYTPLYSQTPAPAGAASAAGPGPLAGKTLAEFAWDSRETGFGIDIGGDELETFGPSAIVMTGAGPAVLDDVNRRIAICSPQLLIDDTIDLPDGQAIDDVLWSTDGWFATNATLENPGVLRLNNDEFSDAATGEMEIAAQLTGLASGVDTPQLLCEAGALPLNAKGWPASDDTFLRTGQVPQQLFNLGDNLAVIAAGDAISGAAIHINNTRVHLPFNGPIREVRPHSVDPNNGAVYLLVMEVVDVDEIVCVQPWLVACNAAGKIEWAARYPVEETLYIPKNPMTVDKDGRVLALVPRKEAAQIRELDKQTQVEAVPWRAIHTNVRPPELASTDINAALAACRSASAMQAKAYDYLNNYLWHSWNPDIIETGCSGRSRPDYMTQSQSKSYYSIPYKWGGFNTVASYRAEIINNTKKAGDDTSGSTLSCCQGVDCSGFVSRCWGLTTKHATYTLPNVSHLQSGSTVTGDIYNKPYSHVYLVDYEANTSGVKVWHATTGSKDRVMHELRSWGYFSGYDRRRYNNKC